MRKFLYFVLFLFLTLFFLYLTFPAERFVEAELCKRGISHGPVLKVKKFPYLKVELYELKVPGVPFKIPYLSVKPSPLILLGKEAPVEFSGSACGGEVKGWFTYPFKGLSYHLCMLSIEECLGDSRVGGRLSSSGTLTFSGKELAKGIGEFSIDNFTLKNLTFGLFSTEKLTFEKVKGTYEVKRKNLIEVEAEGHGKEGQFELKGEVNYNPTEPLSSYGSFKIRVKLETEPFNGKEFNFTVRGNLKELRF